MRILVAAFIVLSGRFQFTLAGALRRYRDVPSMKVPR